jgi:hypothetical protein
MSGHGLLVRGRKNTVFRALPVVVTIEREQWKLAETPGRSVEPVGGGVRRWMTDVEHFLEETALEIRKDVVRMISLA